MIYLRELYTLVAAFAFITLTNSHPTYSDTQKPTADSTIIEHHLDGSIAEWPAGKFSTDEETKIRYMADNDSINLYLALSVPDQGMQMKMSRIGMKLYIDLKGKKKESMGIEFPLKKIITRLMVSSLVILTGKI
ncbi:MAG TPA: hypothetical protein VLJ68_06745 [Chitinophagaceae bacterium]|nr:hypothetical protein [Chitinophagaceae bacterium]